VSGAAEQSTPPVRASSASRIGSTLSGLMCLGRKPPQSASPDRLAESSPPRRSLSELRHEDGAPSALRKPRLIDFIEIEGKTDFTREFASVRYRPAKVLTPGQFSQGMGNSADETQQAGGLSTHEIMPVPQPSSPAAGRARRKKVRFDEDGITEQENSKRSLIEAGARKFYELSKTLPEKTFGEIISAGKLPDHFHAEFDDELRGKDKHILRKCNEFEKEKSTAASLQHTSVGHGVRQSDPQSSRATEIEIVEVSVMSTNEIMPVSQPSSSAAGTAPLREKTTAASLQHTSVWPKWILKKKPKKTETGPKSILKKKEPKDNVGQSEIVEVSAPQESTPRPLPSAADTASSERKKTKFHKDVTAQVEITPKFLNQRLKMTAFHDLNDVLTEKNSAAYRDEADIRIPQIRENFDTQVERAVKQLEALVQQNPGVFDDQIANWRVPKEALVGTKGLENFHLDVIAKFQDERVKRRESEWMPGLIQDAVRRLTELSATLPQETFEEIIGEEMLPDDFHAEFEDELLGMDGDILGKYKQIAAEKALALHMAALAPSDDD